MSRKCLYWLNGRKCIQLGYQLSSSQTSEFGKAIRTNAKLNPTALPSTGFQAHQSPAGISGDPGWVHIFSSLQSSKSFKDFWDKEMMSEKKNRNFHSTTPWKFNSSWKMMLGIHHPFLLEDLFFSGANCEKHPASRISAPICSLTSGFNTTRELKLRGSNPFFKEKTWKKHKENVSATLFVDWKNLDCLPQKIRQQIKPTGPITVPCLTFVSTGIPMCLLPGFTGVIAHPHHLKILTTLISFCSSSTAFTTAVKRTHAHWNGPPLKKCMFFFRKDEGFCCTNHPFPYNNQLYNLICVSSWQKKRSSNPIRKKWPQVQVFFPKTSRASR